MRAALLLIVLGLGAIVLGAETRGIVDLEGREVDPLARGTITVLLFTRTDCPISNRYAPEVRRLSERYAARGVTFWLVYPDARTTAEQIRKHLAEYGYPIDAVRDPRHALVEAAGVRVTPEAAVYAGGRLVYHGRIDDRFPGFGQAREEPSSHDLAVALDAVLDGKDVATPVTEAVGCYLADLAKE
jgi:hypothetical protein